eukprot:TRINITY_DN4545_c0_g1_i1.p1 TRINITY_DN4545_c0_g1~~TRINITY_DN4545_c0_g1_i1.p1  ORF type:complete len:280 (-),score=57.33 TRINITY_DN4545_c0_g1_i1:347-1186(-)
MWCQPLLGISLFLPSFLAPPSLSLENKVEERKDEFISQDSEDLVASPHSISEVVQGFLYISDTFTSCNREKLDKLNVGSILSVTKKNTPHPLRNEFWQLSIEMSDSPNADILPILQQAHSFIEESKKNGLKVLVHCETGMSRSSAVILSYLVQHHQMNLTQAYNHLKSRRKIISPTLQQVYSLLKFEHSVCGAQSNFLAIYIRETFHMEGTELSVLESAVRQAGNDVMLALRILMQPLMVEPLTHTQSPPQQTHDKRHDSHEKSISLSSSAHITPVSPS